MERTKVFASSNSSFLLSRPTKQGILAQNFGTNRAYFSMSL